MNDIVDAARNEHKRRTFGSQDILDAVEFLRDFADMYETVGNDGYARRLRDAADELERLREK